MASEAREATAAITHDVPLDPFQLVYAVTLVGAGLLAVLVLLYGVTHSQSPGGLLYALVGLVSYLAVWGWGILLANGY